MLLGNDGKYYFRKFIAITTDPQRLSGIHFRIDSGTRGWIIFLAVLKQSGRILLENCVFSNHVKGEGAKVTQCFGGRRKLKYFK